MLSERIESGSIESYGRETNGEIGWTEGNSLGIEIEIAGSRMGWGWVEGWDGMGWDIII